MALCLFFGHGYAFNEINKAVTVTLRRNWGDLRPVMGKAFEKVFNPFDGPVLLRYQRPYRGRESKQNKEKKPLT